MHSTDDVFRTSLTETAATSTTQVANGGVDWSSARGAFMVDGRLYTGWADGTFTWRPFNGTTFGTPRTSTCNDLTAFSSELAGIRGMWFDRMTGRMYFTIRGQNQLYYRYFTPESNTVGAVRFTAPNTGAGIDWSRVTGGFLANGKLYYSTTATVPCARCSGRTAPSPAPAPWSAVRQSTAATGGAEASSSTGSERAPTDPEGGPHTVTRPATTRFRLEPGRGDSHSCSSSGRKVNALVLRHLNSTIDLDRPSASRHHLKH